MSKIFTRVVICLICFITLITLTECENDFFDDILNNPYRELRIPPWSSMQQIKQRYKELVKAYHPDKTKNRNANDKFLAIQKAYERIKMRKRAAEREDSYDEYDEYESEEMKSFNDAMSDALKIITAIGASLGLIYFISWVCYKLCTLIYGFLFSLITSFVICDRMFPHYFKNYQNQILYSIIWGIFLFYLKRMLKVLFARLFKKKTVEVDKKMKDQKNK